MCAEQGTAWEFPYRIYLEFTSSQISNKSNVVVALPGSIIPYSPKLNQRWTTEKTLENEDSKKINSSHSDVVWKYVLTQTSYFTHTDILHIAEIIEEFVSFRKNKYKSYAFHGGMKVIIKQQLDSVTNNVKQFIRVGCKAQALSQLLKQEMPLQKFFTSSKKGIWTESLWHASYFLQIEWLCLLSCVIVHFQERYDDIFHSTPTCLHDNNTHYNNNNSIKEKAEDVVIIK